LGSHKNWYKTPSNFLLTIDVPLLVPDTPIAFDQYLVPRGLQPGENPLSEEAGGTSLPPLNEAASAQLQEMGFPAVRVEKALRVTGNDNAEVAMQWLFEHMDDPDIDIPYNPNPNPTTTGAIDVDPENMNNLMGMGFDEHMARKALQETVPSP
jgi:ubiquitin carboxyl-terminal hydrolase 5/13